MTILFERSRPVALTYEVLARIDLGRDAANLYDSTRASRPWADALTKAYRAAPGRLLVQAAALVDPDDVRSRLRRMLREGADLALAQCFITALDDLQDAPVDWGTPSEALLEAWTELRAALWERRGALPTWRIYDAPALGWAGRATQVAGEQRIAVALSRPADHVVCQVFHEAIHAVTDPVVGAGPTLSRSTSAEDPGFAIHQRLEEAAVEVGRAIIEARRPALAPAYERWCSRWR